MASDSQRPNDEVDPPSILDELAPFGSRDRDALSDLEALFNSVKAADATDPPDVQRLWQRIQRGIAREDETSSDSHPPEGG